MKYSKLFGKTVRQAPKEAVFASHKLLYQGGFIRESTAGRYYFLPLGWRIHDKIKAIIKDEMDKIGAQEMISPVLHPIELWQETNRTNTTGFELMSVKDARGAEFALGGTAEEMFVDLIRKFTISYKELPFSLYQFSTKFRDEKRARGGLLRVREFVMKDAYSFDRNAAEFKKTYETYAQAYTRIFNRLGLDTLQVAADNGYIGGEYCHEYQVESDIGEGRFFMTPDGTYCAHADIASFDIEPLNIQDEPKTMEIVEAKRGPRMEDGVKLHGLPLWQQLKCVMFTDRQGKLFMAVIRGDLDVNQTKLENTVERVGQLQLASDEAIRQAGSEPGFISPVKISDQVTVIADVSLGSVRNFYGGANTIYRDALNINPGRDFKPEKTTDIALAQPGFVKNGQALVEKRGIEVGNIFQLGYHYTNLMQGADFISENGQETKYYMGCYGIGIGRTMAAIVEKYHDEKGIIWPEAVAPYTLHLIHIGNVAEKAEMLYHRFQEAGLEVLWDDREESPGVKFSDCDLIGSPWRVVISPKTEGQIELRQRSDKESRLVPAEDLIAFIKPLDLSKQI